MADIAKLKKRALDFEQKKQLDKALAEYVKILAEMDSHVDEADVALYNRVGDLMLRQGNAPQAVQYYERAVDLYTEGGFFNNAIALCNKILRNSPGHSAVYYKLGKISAKKGFINDAKQHFLEYADRMQKENRLEEAFRALKEFADLCPDQDDIRLMLAEQLVKRGRKTEAVEQLQMLYEKYEMEGRGVEAGATATRMRAIDPTIEPRTGAVMKTPRQGDLVFLDVTYDGGPAKRPPVPSPTAARTAPPPLVEPPLPAAAAHDANDLPLLSVEDDTLAAPSMPGLSLGSAHEQVETPEASAPDTMIAGVEHTAMGDDAGERDRDIALIFPEDSPFDSMDVPDRVEWSAADRAAEGESPVSVADAVLDDALADMPTAMPAAMADSAPSSFDDALLDDGTMMLPDAGWEQFDVVSPAEARGGPHTSADGGVEPFAELEMQTLDATTPECVDDSTRDLSNGDSTAFEIQLEQSAFLSSADLLGRTEPVTPRRADAAASEESAPGDVPDVDAEGMAPATVEPSGALDEVGDDLLFIELSPFDADDVERASPPLVFLVEPDEIAAAYDVPAQPVHSPIELLRQRAQNELGNWRVHQELGVALASNGEHRSARATLESALGGAERDGDGPGARAILDALVSLDPESLTLHQKRVEHAVRAADRPALIEAYGGLADCLLRSGFADKARVIYGRILDLAPDHAPAAAALEQLPETRASIVLNGVARTTGQMMAIPAPGTHGTPPWPARDKPTNGAVAATHAPNGERFVNLADWLREDTPKSTRMVVEGKEPSGNAQQDVGDVLTAFKQGVASNVDETDYESHYDLGVAYKQMGLLDEAIAEFQKALRGTEQRVRTYEALGQCFVEKKQYQIALTILSRALNDKSYTDEMLVGVLYLLGFGSESLGRTDDAVAFYERVVSVDIQFRDVGDRLAALERSRS